MTLSQANALYKALTTIPPIADTEDSYFSNKHMMTNKELLGQLEGYVREIYTAFNPEIPAIIYTRSVPKNGAKFTVKYINDVNKGYTGTVYAIARKNNIIQKIIDIFQNGAVNLV